MTDRRVLLFAFFSAFQGCAAGYHWYRTPELHRTGAADDWSAFAFVVETAEATPLVATAVHNLRARHGVIAARAVGLPEDKGLTLSFATGPRHDSYGWFIPSFLSFSVLPGYAEEDNEVTLTATASDGARMVVSRTRRSVMVSWLPLIFAGGNFVFGLNDQGPPDDDVERLRTIADEQIVEALLEDIAPFVAAHARPVASSRP